MQLKVPSSGPHDADVMIVGEAPGSEEVKHLTPFIGLSGKELDRMLHQTGYLRTECYVTNVCKYRPPGNKIKSFFIKQTKANIIPGPEIEEGIQELGEEIERVKPKLIIALGETALWALTGNSGITKWRGSELLFNNEGPVQANWICPLVPTYHPAAILRQWSWLEYFNHWKPKRESEHLHAGAAFAKGLETTRKAYWLEKLSVRDSIAAGAIAIIREWGDYDEPPGSVKSLPNILGAFTDYWLHYGFDTDHVQPYSPEPGRLAVEFSFAIPIPSTAHPETGEPILYTGRFDMIGQMGESLYVEDDKTTSQLGPSWFKKWELRSQLTGYCWAARQFGIPVKGAIVRGVAIRTRDFGHAEAIQYRSDYEINRWLHQLTRDTNRMIECWKEGYFDYSLADACESYGGCLFLPVCKSENPERWLNQDFVQRVWDPLA